MEETKGIFSHLLEIIKEILLKLGWSGIEGAGQVYTAIARWVFILLALFIVFKAIASLLRSRGTPEIFAFFNIEGEKNLAITHWENAVGRSKKSDIVITDPAVSRTQGTLTRDDVGNWKFMDLGSSNGTVIRGKRLEYGESATVEPGDKILMGDTECTILPISLEEQRRNKAMRRRGTKLLSPWTSLIALTIFQLMTIIQFRVSYGSEMSDQILIGFLGLALLMWIYVIGMSSIHQKGFDMEILAFFLVTLSLSVTASKYPNAVFKQFVAVCLGLALFIAMCLFMRNLERTKAVRKYIYVLAAVLLIVNLVFARNIYGANNWIMIGGTSIQPSELTKLAFIWVGAASLDELLERRNTLIFMGFSFFCFGCLALMNDFGTAIIFFVTFLVISFLRNGDLTKLILVVGVAGIAGMLVLRFKSHVAYRFSAWGHVWDFADTSGYQQTRSMSAAASGGLVGVGAGDGWLKNIAASETDLVFAFVTEEWGLIIAILAVLTIITLSIFAFRSILNGRSTYYTIAACAATSLFLFQTILNIFGSVDLFPLTGVTFPFLSTGGTSMIASWGMLAFLKAADTRQGASVAVKENAAQEVEYA